MLKRVLAVLMCISFFIPFVSCSKAPEEEKKPENTTVAATDANDSSTEAETTGGIPKPDLPDMDMEGKAFKILSAGWHGNPGNYTDISPDSITAEPVNDAAYLRMTTIEQDYNCSISTIPDYDHKDAVTQVQQAVLANDNTYDIAIIRGSTFINLLIGNSYLNDYSEIPYIDVENPWWDKNVYDALAIGGSHFGVVGAINLEHFRWLWTVYFNKGIIRDFALESPFDLVKAGTWTFDKMMSMAKVVAKDLDNNEIMDGNDFWGLVFTGDSVMGILTTAGITIANLDEDGLPVITINSESNITKFLNIYSKIHDHSYSADALFSLENTSVHQIFTPGNSLFMIDGMLGAGGFRDADVDFGIVPVPKYSESDEQYSTRGGQFLPVVCIPKPNEDFENTGFFLEAFAQAGHYTIVPAFYEIVLKTKIARDEESAEMIEYIFNDVRHDTGELFNLGGIIGTLCAGISRNPNTNIASLVERNYATLERDVKRILEQLNK